jgi:hypothetical protein
MIKQLKQNNCTCNPGRKKSFQRPLLHVPGWNLSCVWKKNIETVQQMGKTKAPGLIAEILKGARAETVKSNGGSSGRW